MESVNEIFGETNVKCFFVWNIFFLVYALAINSSLLTFICVLIAFAVAGITAIRYIERNHVKDAPA